MQFKLVDADTERDNNRAQQGGERRFMLCEETPWLERQDAGEAALVLRFEYRPDEQKRKQADLNAAAAQRLLNDPDLRAWIGGLNQNRGTEANPNRTLLEKHLTDYTAKNSFDYFIHKDLGGFLRRELDFFIKNEIMHLDDIESDSAPRVEQYLAKVRALRRIAHKIIRFLEQMENFQKKLWLKKKFVVETNWCVTLDRVPEDLYPAICENDAQRREWMRLFAIDEITAQEVQAGQQHTLGGESAPVYSEPLTVDFLKANPSETILDYFAGSGTTAHAVINLNREDGGSRKYILVEVGEYFDTVLKPRIQKVVYSDSWRDGKPVSRQGSSHMFKYMRLESYEDAQNNLQLSRSQQQQTLLDMAQPQFREDYMLGYMLDVESEGSASLLNIDAFQDPFAYQMRIATASAGGSAGGGAGAARAMHVDLVETFNYLIGLSVKTMDFIRGFQVVTGAAPTGERVLILWRNTNEQSNADLDEFFRRQNYNTRDQEFDIIYVNGDNNLENLRREDQTWKVRLIEEDFKRLMFDVEDV